MRTGLTLLAVTLSCGVAAAQDKAGPGLRFLVLGEGRPQLVAVAVEIDGQSAPKLWKAGLRKWFDHADFDGDGQLDREEAQAMPSAVSLARMARQRAFLPAASDSLTFAALGKEVQEKATFEEVLAHYEAKGAAPMLIVPPLRGAPAFVGPDPVFKALDKDGDGKLTRDEIKAAGKLLQAYDLSGDEFLTLQELAPTAAQPGFNPFVPNPGPLAAPKWPAPLVLSSPQTAPKEVAVALLAAYDRDKDGQLDAKGFGLPEAAFAKADADGDGKLSALELGRFPKALAPVALRVRLGKADGPVVEMQDDGKTGAKLSGAADRPRLVLGDVPLDFDPLPAAQAVRPISTQLVQFFKTAAGNNPLPKKGLESDARARAFLPLFPFADRDRDDRLTEREVQVYSDLADAMQGAFALVGAHEESASLFQALDANRDSRLWAGELLTAWDRLAPLDRDGSGGLSQAEISKTFVLSFARGGQNLLGFRPPVVRPPIVGGLPAAPARGPDWFRKMDVSGDGDVSRAEFLGPRALFDQIDANRDGLIDPDEAEAFDRKKKN